MSPARSRARARLRILVEIVGLARHSHDEWWRVVWIGRTTLGRAVVPGSADAFEASFLPGPDEDLGAVCNVDVFVDLDDGSRWSATVFTVTEVERLMATWAGSDEALGGRYFWVSDGLIVRDPGIDNMTQAIAGLIDNGEFSEVFERLDGD